MDFRDWLANEELQGPKNVHVPRPSLNMKMPRPANLGKNPYQTAKPNLFAGRGVLKKPQTSFVLGGKT